MTDSVIAIATSDDLFLGDRLIVRQPLSGYRAGADAVILAASIRDLPPGARVLDVGSGVGTVALCVASRFPSAEVALVEREPDLASLARHNIMQNGFAGRLMVVETDLARATAALDAAGIASESFDHVLANPPYHDDDAGTAPPNGLKAASHQMPPDSFETWARFFTRMASAGGRVTVIHKPSVLPRLLAALDGRFGAIRVTPILPRAGNDAVRILITGTKGSRAPLTITAPVILHTDGQAFRPEIDDVFRRGAPLPL